MDENSLPACFISSIQPLLGNKTDTFLSALAGETPVSFRLNPLKAARNPMEPLVPLQRVPWSLWGYYLEQRPAFTFDPLFHAGYYYVQEASSMFVEHLVRELVKEPAMCLDLCAAPGGKSVSLLSALPEGSLLVSNETVRQRAQILSETVIKYGHPNTMVVNNTAKDIGALTHVFDLILVDAPCSGEGMFRKDETAVREWSPQNVAMCATRQREIMCDVWPALKPGGLLIYSTCTYNTAENEENALWVANKLGAEFVRMEIEDGWGIAPSFDRLSDGNYYFPGTTKINHHYGNLVHSSVTGYRFFPHKTQGEGLFVTVLRKTGKDEGEISNGWVQGKGKSYLSKSVKGRTKNAAGHASSPWANVNLLVNERQLYSGLLSESVDFDFVETSGNRIVALPAVYSDVLIDLNKRLKTVSMGVEVGERKGKDFVPSHTLAMSSTLHPQAFTRHDISYAEAIAYLRRETVTLPDAPIGYLLLTFKREPLGFVKNLGNRANNLYPNEWRIRSGYLPEKKVEIF